MTVNRTTLLDLPLPVTGTESGTWGDTTNNGLTQYVDIAIAGMSNLTSANFTAGALTIETTEGDSSATNISATSAQYAGFRVTSLAANSTITVGNTGTSPARSYRLINADATYSLTFKATGQTGVTLLPGQSALVAFNGTDYVIVGTVGAGSTTDNTVPRFDGTTGKILQSSGITIDDSNNVSGVAQLNITTLDATNIEVTNIKAKDGTAAASIADSTGVISVTANPVLSGGTANGVLYLNGSKVATSGSALTFDGSTLTVAPDANRSFKLQSLGTYSMSLENPSADSGASIQFKTNGTFLWSRGASDAMALTSTGLGIGTSSVTSGYKLEAQNGTSGTGIRVSNTGGGYAALSISSNAASVATLGFTNTLTITDGTNNLVYDSGNLGLGVTPSAWSLGKALEVAAVGNGLWTVGNANIYLVSNTYYASGAYRYASTNPASAYEQENGVHKWRTASSGTAGNAITFSQVMTLDASGNLGVGTTSPAQRLHVSVATVGAGAFLQVSNTGDSQTAYFGTNTSGGSIQVVGANPLQFATNNTERARITSGGDVVVTGVGGLGYGTGSGGADTQATSRTTGVTLDKTNGAITLVSAAGTTTWQTFTVTNNKVAATDTVIVNQKSGTDLYQIFVTNVAAGSFKISFATTGGTTTEQPVFNFAVIKAVTA